MMIGAKAPILCIYRTNTQYVDKIVDNCTMTQIISRKEARKMTLKEILGTSGGILFMLFSWLGAMLGFDKVTQMILQIVNAAPGKGK